MTASRLCNKARERPYYAGEIRKRSFISTVRPTVHTNPSQKWSFSKTLFKPEAFENILKTELFEKDGVTIIMIFPCLGLLKHKSKMTGDCCVFKFLRHSVDGKHLMRFRGDDPLFLFPSIFYLIEFKLF